jgi:uncharacterized membrane protein
VESTIIKSNPKNLLLIILFFQFIVYATVFFDIPVVRQIAGLVYFTFVPGFIIVKLLRMKEIGRLETVLFSIGFSIAFLMIAGLVIDVFGLAVGFSEPLSLIPLMVVLNAMILIGAILVYSRKESIRLFEDTGLKLPPIAVLLIALPIFGIIGAMWVTAHESNLILLTLTMAVALVFVFGVVSEKIFPSKVYPLAIIAIALFLLYLSTFISRNVVFFGSDINNELYVSKLTQTLAFWSSAFTFSGSELFGRYYSMLSVTVLPTLYSTLLNMGMAWVFKIVYPMIFCLVPLGLYQLWQSMLGKKRAFVAAFLLMAQITFYTEMLGLARQMVAELFFVLLLIVIFNKKIKPLQATICFTVFSIGLITAHYALAEIFLFFISLALIYSIVLKHKSRQLSVMLVIFFFVAMFSWYVFTSGSATFNSFVTFGGYVSGQLSNFLSPSSRGQTVLQGLGLAAAPTIWTTISRAFAYLTEALIVLGIIGLLTRKTAVRFEREYSVFTLTAFAILVATIVVPGLANTLNETRFYHILLFFLAPMCVVGAEFLFQLIPKRRIKIGALILLVVILVPYFLFQTGFVYEITGTQSYSLPLSMHRMDAFFLRWDMGYFDDSEVTGSLWMSRNANVKGSEIYADAASGPLLVSSGIYPGEIETLSNVTVLPQNSFVYLNTANLVENVGMGPFYTWNTTSLSHTLASADLVYSNGGCQIYNNANTP